MYDVEDVSGVNLHCRLRGMCWQLLTVSTHHSIVKTSDSQPPGRGPVAGPGIYYTGPREVLEFVILVF